MKERPILFKPEMVNAILEGRKTQTRRICTAKDVSGKSFYSYSKDAMDALIRHGPYGKPGDRLWVRESWRTCSGFNHLKPSELIFMCSRMIHYEANGTIHPGSAMGKLRPSIFMPRAFSRILLEITGVRIERLNDISEEDAKAEGAENTISSDNCIEKYLPKKWDLSKAEDIRFEFCYLWQSINGPGSFNDKWVWVIEFELLSTMEKG